MAATIEVRYFNSFILRKTVDDENSDRAAYKPDETTESKNWLIEESRIKGGFAETSVDFGVRAFLVAETNTGSIRSSGLIHSGVFNSRTGVNYTNQFPVGEEITKGLNPAKGSIQKLYAEDSNLTIFQEHKVSKALINKDAVYTAEGQPLTTSTNLVIGQIVPYAGEYGISTDPGSFAVYGYRKYFTDKNKNAVLRLSMDGITEISSYGMRDYFRDKMTSLDFNDAVKGEVIGGWDIHSKSYMISLKPWNEEEAVTISFDEKVKGWVSFYSYMPDISVSLKNSFYSIKESSIYKHYVGDFNTFYGQEPVESSIKFIFNGSPSSSKTFKTISYEGSNGWKVNSIVSDIQGVDQNFHDEDDNSFEQFSDAAKPIESYAGGAYIVTKNNTVVTPSSNEWYQEYSGGGIVYRTGFDRKENKYVAPIKNNSLPRPGEISGSLSVAGIKGFTTTVEMATDSIGLNTKKELYAVNTNVVIN